MTRQPPTAIIVLSCLLAACTASPTVGRKADAGASAPSVVPTRTPRPTVTPTSTPSATPDVPLYDAGAWLLFQGIVPDTDEENSHLWAVNWDGTGLSDLLPGLA